MQHPWLAEASQSHRQFAVVCRNKSDFNKKRGNIVTLYSNDRCLLQAIAGQQPQGADQGLEQFWSDTDFVGFGSVGQPEPVHDCAGTDPEPVFDQWADQEPGRQIIWLPRRGGRGRVPRKFKQFTTADCGGSEPESEQECQANLGG